MDHDEIGASEKEELLTIKAVARMVGAKYRTVWAWIRSGRLPALNTAPPGARQARIRVRRSDVEALMREYQPLSADGGKEA